MSFRLEWGPPLDEELARVVRERLDAANEALDRLRGKDERSREAVHDARKRLRQARAVVRLMQSGMGRRRARAANRALRDAARPLSELRDADVACSLVERLQEEEPGLFDDERYGLVRVALEQRRDALYQRFLDEPTRLETLHTIIGATARELAAEHLPDDFAALADGLRATDAAARRAMAASRDDEAQLHEWRKRTKDLRHQLELLSALSSTLVEPLAKAAHDLTDHLGDDHDLLALGGLFEGPLAHAVEPEERERLLRVLAHRREHLQREARALGAQLFAESPKALRSRIARYAEAAEAVE